MEEIKLRAWHKLKKQMYQVGVYDIVHKCVNCCELTDNPPYCRFTFPFEDVEIMPYIGKKDIHDKEIYEGDILLAPAWYEDNLKCVCIYQQENNVNYVQGFGLYSLDKYLQKYCDLIASDEWDEFEILGNIYENFELLEEK